jgi:hypothetical protein
MLLLLVVACVPVSAPMADDAPDPIDDTAKSDTTDPVELVVMPTQATISPGATLQLRASAADVSWWASRGTISADGLLYAPSGPSTVTVTATSSSGEEAVATVEVAWARGDTSWTTVVDDSPDDRFFAVAATESRVVALGDRNMSEDPTFGSGGYRGVWVAALHGTGGFDGGFGDAGRVLLEPDGFHSQYRGVGAIVEDDGGIVVLWNRYSEGPVFGLLRLDHEGTPAMGPTRSGTGVVVRRDGDAFIVGATEGVYRCDASLEPDPAWGEDGVAVLTGGFRVLDVQPRPDGGWLVLSVGYTTDGGFVILDALDEAGARDPRWGDRGRASGPMLDLSGDPSALAVDSAGRAVVSAGVYVDARARLAALRFGRDGALDPTFGDGGVAVAASVGPKDDVVVRPGGGVLFGGETQLYLADDRGQADDTFGEHGTVTIDMPVGPGRMAVWDDHAWLVGYSDGGSAANPSDAWIAAVQLE